MRTNSNLGSVRTVEPNIQSIVITNIIGVVLLTSLLITSYLTRERRHTHDRIFTALIFVCGGACICETATWLVDGNPAPWAFTINYLGNTYCYLATNLYAYLWVLYMDLRLHKGEERIVRRYPALLAATAILSAAILGNLAGGYMFTIDEHNVYSRQPLSYINYAMTFFMLFYSIWVKHRYERDHGKVRFFPMYMFLVPVMVGAGVQAAVLGISVAWTSVAVALVSIHMSLQNELSYVDPLTNLYNRTYLDYSLQAMVRGRGAGSGIMIDLDFFKDINDNLGHSAGDEALRDAAGILVEAAPSNALVVRFAGDEFIMLLKSSDEAEACRVEEAVRAGVSAFNAQAGKPYKLSLSMGHSTFSAGDDSVDEFLRRIDERMYAEKRRKHELAGSTR